MKEEIKAFWATTWQTYSSGKLDLISEDFKKQLKDLTFESFLASKNNFNDFFDVIMPLPNEFLIKAAGKKIDFFLTNLRFVIHDEQNKSWQKFNLKDIRHFTSKSSWSTFQFDLLLNNGERKSFNKISEDLNYDFLRNIIRFCTGKDPKEDINTFWKLTYDTAVEGKLDFIAENITRQTYIPFEIYLQNAENKFNIFFDINPPQQGEFFLGSNSTGEKVDWIITNKRFAIHDSKANTWSLFYLDEIKLITLEKSQIDISFVNGEKKQIGIKNFIKADNAYLLNVIEHHNEIGQKVQKPKDDNLKENLPNEVLIKDSPYSYLIWFLVFMGVGALLFWLMSSGYLQKQRESGGLEGIAAVIMSIGAIILPIAAIFTLLKFLFYFVRSRSILINDKELVIKRFFVKSTFDLTKVNWKYEPHTETGFLSNLIWGFLFVSSGMHIEIPKYGSLRLCPGVFSSKSTDLILKKLEQIIGYMPRMTVGLFKSNNYSVIGRFPSNKPIVISNEKTSEIVISELANDMRFSINQVDPNYMFFIVHNMSVTNRISYVFKEKTHYINPLESVRLNDYFQVNLGGGNQLRIGSVTDSELFTLPFYDEF
jgi:hypothetical protein